MPIGPVHDGWADETFAAGKSRLLRRTPMPDEMYSSQSKFFNTQKTHVLTFRNPT